MTSSGFSRSHTVLVRPGVQITLTEAGEGRPALILHGGGGPFTVANISAHLAQSMHTLLPTHPGWNDTPRPDWLSSIGDIAQAYLQHLEDTDLRDVLVVGNSIGGWIGSEMAVRDEAARITGLILIDAVGVQIEGQPIRDFFALDARGVTTYSFHDADRFYRDPATITAKDAAVQQANMATLRVVAGDPYMYDPTLLGRLSGIKTPSLVVWGDSDRIVTPAYGRAYAAAFTDARFEIIKDAGHLPQLEQPDATFAVIDHFATTKQGMTR